MSDKLRDATLLGIIYHPKLRHLAKDADVCGCIVEMLKDFERGILKEQGLRYLIKIEAKELAKEIFDTEDRLRKDTLGGYLTEKGIEAVISSFLREEENDE